LRAALAGSHSNSIRFILDRLKEPGKHQSSATQSVSYYLMEVVHGIMLWTQEVGN
jgi:hypothetical protein